MIRYALRRNPFSDDGYTAQVTGCGICNHEDLIERMAQRGSFLSKGTITAALSLYEDVVCDLLADGYALNTPLFNASFSMKGLFRDSDDSFTRSRHLIQVNLSPGTAIRKATAKIRVRKTAQRPVLPQLIQILDLTTGAVNTSLTRGGVLLVYGNRLKYQKDCPEQGVFLVDLQGQAFRCSFVAENKPGKLMAVVPSDIASGSYRLEVRTKLDASRQPSMTLRTGLFRLPLSII